MDLAGTTRLSFLGRLSDRSSKLGWAELDERYRELLYRYARRRGAAHVEAEDIVQEVLMYVYRASERFEYNPARGRFRSYLRTAVVHAMSRRAARLARQGCPTDPDVLIAAAEANEPADAEWEREWQLHQLRCAMRFIAAEFETTTLEAFRLHVLAGWTADATARSLGVSVASVYQSKCRVLKRLRERVDSLGETDGAATTATVAVPPAPPSPAAAKAVSKANGKRPVKSGP